MLKLSSNSRTTWVGTLKTTAKTNSNGQAYTSKSISFQIASNRDYKSVKKDINGNVVIDPTTGKQIEEKQSDFIWCRAYGSIAQVIADYCSAKDPATGKLVSRHLSLTGTLETYKSVKEMQHPISVAGVIYNVPIKHEVENTIFIVKELEFLDSNQKTKEALNRTPSQPQQYAKQTTYVPTASVAGNYPVASAPAPITAPSVAASSPNVVPSVGVPAYASVAKPQSPSDVSPAILSRLIPVENNTVEVNANSIIGEPPVVPELEPGSGIFGSDNDPWA